MTSGSEMWQLAVGLIKRLKLTQQTLERAMFSISLRDKISNEEIHINMKVTDIALIASKLKSQGTGHIF